MQLSIFVLPLMLLLSCSSKPVAIEPPPPPPVTVEPAAPLDPALDFLEGLDLPVATANKVFRELFAKAFDYEEIDAGAALPNGDTTSYGQEMTVSHEVTYSNQQLIGIKTSRDWCTAYCSADFYSTFYDRTTGESITADEIFTDVAAAKALREDAEKRFKAELYEAVKELRTEDEAAETNEIADIQEEYCGNWTASDFSLTPNGLLFEQGCGMPNVIKAYEYSPDLLIPYAEVKGLKKELF